MVHITAPGDLNKCPEKGENKRSRGYTLLILVFFVFILGLGLMVTVPVWETQIQREKEEELIFRGKQFVEAIRIFQTKFPGTFPSSLQELEEKKCIRRLYQDPMSKEGEWDLILPYETGTTRPRRQPSPQIPSGQPQSSTQKVMVVPNHLLSQVDNPRIIGVVSSSSQESIKVYFEQRQYNKWLFFYGQDQKNLPEIVYFSGK